MKSRKKVDKIDQAVQKTSKKFLKQKQAIDADLIIVDKNGRVRRVKARSLKW